MGNLFGKNLTPKQMMRESQRMLRRGMRELDRERAKLQAQEKKVVNEIKGLARKGQMGAAKIMAKDLVRTKNAVTHFYKMKAQLQAVSIRIQTMQSTASMESAMRGAAKAMYRMNRAVNVPAMQRIMMTFEREGDMMEMKQEMMDDTIDDVMAEEGDDEAANEILNQVLDEIGIDVAGGLNNAPSAVAQGSSSKVPAQAIAGAAGGRGGGGGSGGGSGGGGSGGGPPGGAAAGGGGVDDLAARLHNLRRNDD